jgi:hypothetical protein
MSKKYSNDTNRNRNREHPACSVVPLPTAPPRVPHKLGMWEDKYATGLIQIEFEGVNLVNVARKVTSR